MLTSPTGGAGPPSRGRRLLSAIALTGRPLVAAGVGQRLAFAAVGIALWQAICRSAGGRAWPAGC